MATAILCVFFCGFFIVGARTKNDTVHAICFLGFVATVLTALIVCSQ